MNPRDGGFAKRAELFISSLNVACFAESVVKRSSHLRGGISIQGPKIVIFSGSWRAFLFDYFEPRKKIMRNPRDGLFSQRPKLFTSSITVTGCAGSGEKIDFNVRGGISIKGQNPSFSVPHVALSYSIPLDLE